MDQQAANCGISGRTLRELGIDKVQPRLSEWVHKLGWEAAGTSSLAFRLNEPATRLDLGWIVDPLSFQIYFNRIVVTYDEQLRVTELDVGSCTFEEVKKLLLKTTLQLKLSAREL